MHLAKGYCQAHYARKRRGRTSCTDEPIRKNNPKGEGMRWLIEHRNWDSDECLIWPFGKNGNGRGTLTIGKLRGAHVHMCVMVHGARPSSKHEVAHSCGNGHLACVSPRHLRWDTRKGNMEDRLKHGTLLRGEKAIPSILKENDVRKIRSMLGHHTLRAIATAFCVHETTINNIKTGKTWGWLK